MHHTQEREQKIRLWLDMWLRREDLGILELFAPDAVYLESWGPEYHGAAAIRHWFQEWNTRGRVEVWDSGIQTKVTLRDGSAAPIYSDSQRPLLPPGGRHHCGVALPLCDERRRGPDL